MRGRVGGSRRDRSPRGQAVGGPASGEPSALAADVQSPGGLAEEQPHRTTTGTVFARPVVHVSSVTAARDSRLSVDENRASESEVRSVNEV